MTSYATTNDTTNPNNSATAAGVEQVSTTATTEPTTTTIDHLAAKLATTPLQDLHFTTPYFFDSDTLSDGREKSDTTPENIKKIDDVIDEQQQQQQQQLKRSAYQTSQQPYVGNSSAASATSATAAASAVVADVSTQLKLGYGSVGLAAAVDDSNAKIRLAKKLCNEKDTLRKSERIPNYNIMEALTTSHHVDDNKVNKFNANNASNECADMNEAFDEDSSGSNTANTITDTKTTPNKQSYAFTIDNFNGNDCDPAAAAAKYKSMLERFQSRHKRGASMSKLENEPTVAMISSASASPLIPRSNRSAADMDASDVIQETNETTPKVKLRARDRSTSRVRDASKRHSWSPRSSAQETQNAQAHTQPALVAMQKPTTMMASMPKKTVSYRKSTSVQQAPKGASNLVANRTQFTPRSTAMQMALQKVDFTCPEPPLNDFNHHLDADANADNVSETGTYTLDGDNYTEEQKEVMNIDENGGQTNKHRPKNLNLNRHSTDMALSTKIPVHVNARSGNVLEVNYYHDEAEQLKTVISNDLIMGLHQSAGDYLKKLKSRVLGTTKDNSADFASSSSSCDGGVSAASSNKNKMYIGNSSQKTSTEEEDVGCFTSVTTSGVLAKQPTLEATPKTARLCLSTSQIDSSEYISNESKLKNAAASSYAKGGFTDHQKAAYRLNVFTNQKDTHKFAATRRLIESPPESPIELSDTAILKTANSKKDWVQEWARNARARSLANETNCHNKHDPQELMTRSYTCATGTAGGDGVIDEKLYAKQTSSHAKLNKTLAERLRGVSDCDYTSDPTLSTYSKLSQDVNYKPPKSPTKIPSPLHTLSRARSSTRARGSLQNIVHADEEDIYLQNTAAAINNLQQSLSRKNSLKSITHSGSPRAYSARPSSTSLYSPENSSPQHSYNSSTAGYHQRSPIHRQNPQYETHPRNQLMTSSINEQQLALLTSGEYLVKQMRMRKNSLDGTIAKSPVHVPDKYVQSAHVESDQDSPLRRSSSFSTKIATQRAARPQYQNIYTPPAARHNYTLLDASSQSSARGAGNAKQMQMSTTQMTKSASSNNFGRMYSDYDDNLQYYINDEDDVGDEYFSDGEEQGLHNANYYEQQDIVHAATDVSEDAPNVPLTNTRYNKALLMRIERSKQKVAGKPTSAPVQGRNNLTAAGVVACPNTPELPRRNVKSAVTRSGAMTARQSMPRDTSLSRLATQVPNSLASAKKQLLQTAAAVPSNAAKSAVNAKVQPKYMDISKYKSAQSNNFLRKNDTRSTLKTDAIKRSPSASGMSISRADPTRMSNRSVRSVASNMTTSTNSVSSARASSAVRRDASVNKQKETELAMWKRRAKYDPMKAAAEDRRRKEEAKKLARNSTGEVTERPSRSLYRRGYL